MYGKFLLCCVKCVIKEKQKISFSWSSKIKKLLLCERNPKKSSKKWRCLINEFSFWGEIFIFMVIRKEEKGKALVSFLPLVLSVLRKRDEKVCVGSYCFVKISRISSLLLDFLLRPKIWKKLTVIFHMLRWWKAFVKLTIKRTKVQAKLHILNVKILLLYLTWWKKVGKFAINIRHKNNGGCEMKSIKKLFSLRYKTIMFIIYLEKQRQAVRSKWNCVS